MLAADRGENAVKQRHARTGQATVPRFCPASGAIDLLEVTLTQREGGEMIQALVETIFEYGFQAVGWAVLKVATLGRYRGFTSDDMLREGALGLLTVVVIGYAIYRWV